MCSLFFMTPLTVFVFFIVVLILFLLQYICFTLLCHFLLYSKVSQPSVESLSHIQLFATPWTAACQVSLSITNSWSLHKLMSIDQVMPSNHLILCHPLLLPPPIFPSIRVFSNKSVGKSQYSLHLPPKYESPLSLFEPGFLRKLNGTWLEKMA